MELNCMPKYRRIAAELARQLRAGAFHANERFYLQRELAARFGVSRTTAVKVLALLEKQGLLQHAPGRGHCVAGSRLTHDTRWLFSFTHKALADGRAPRTVVHAFRRVHPDRAHAALGADALYVERQRFADGLPVIWEQRYLRLPQFARLTRAQCEGSLYDAMEQLGLHADTCDQTIRAALPTRAEQRLLDVPAAFACLLVEGRGYGRDGTLLWMERTLFRGDQYEFCGHLSAAGGFAGNLKTDQGGQST